ncbi:hypothetical protein LSH36_143g01001 [Paralvinella palmiformis]|uniref:Polyprenal reductase n=1 Tax=Paralvinella palmiformis TaxID=53620 RepID=A0AAD9JV44_9ANNE|nr:hypothetical protein LSH36_143g01001 [Paralvinella palmiformis]
MYGIGLTILQGYWALRLGLVSVKFLSHLVSGSFYDKSHGDRSPDEPFGWLEFRKRLGQYYFVGFLGSVWVSYNLLWSCAGYGTSERFSNTVAYLGGPGSGDVDNLHALLAAGMLTFQMGRRFYESFRISIFSGRQVLNIFGALMNLADFFCLGLSIAVDTEIGSGISSFSFSNVSFRPLVAIPLFVFASRLQHNSYLKLARLRKNRAGHIVTTAYKLPNSEWFDLISGPHYLAKILIMASLGIVLGRGCTTWYWLSAYVITNQLYLAHGTHKLYLQKFENYPKHRKVIIPYLF